MGRGGHYNLQPSRRVDPSAKNLVIFHCEAACELCDRSFGLITSRRHHCRHCGKSVCQACSSNTMALPELGLNKAVRVCDPCWRRPNFEFEQTTMTYTLRGYKAAQDSQEHALQGFLTAHTTARNKQTTKEPLRVIPAQASAVNGSVTQKSETEEGEGEGEDAEVGAAECQKSYVREPTRRLGTEVGKHRRLQTSKAEAKSGVLGYSAAQGLTTAELRRDEWLRDLATGVGGHGLGRRSVRYDTVRVTADSKIVVIEEGMHTSEQSSQWW